MGSGRGLSIYLSDRGAVPDAATDIRVDYGRMGVDRGELLWPTVCQWLRHTAHTDCVARTHARTQVLNGCFDNSREIIVKMVDMHFGASSYVCDSHASERSLISRRD